MRPATPPRRSPVRRVGPGRARLFALRRPRRAGGHLAPARDARPRLRRRTHDRPRRDQRPTADLRHRHRLDVLHPVRRRRPPRRPRPRPADGLPHRRRDRHQTRVPASPRQTTAPADPPRRRRPGQGRRHPPRPRHAAGRAARRRIRRRPRCSVGNCLRRRAGPDRSRPRHFRLRRPRKSPRPARRGTDEGQLAAAEVQGRRVVRQPCRPGRRHPGDAGHGKHRLPDADRRPRQASEGSPRRRSSSAWVPASTRTFRCGPGGWRTT